MASINASTSGAGGVITTADNTGILNLQTAGTNAVTVDASQNVTVAGNTYLASTSGSVGIGTTSPNQTLEIKNGVDYQIRVNNGTTAQSYDIGRSTTNGLLYFYGGQTGFTGYVWSGVDGERMRIDSSGNLLVATTTQLSSGRICVDFNQSTHQAITLRNTNAGNGGNYILFLNSSNNQSGLITQTGATTVAYTTSSDYRLKENIVPMVGALDKVLQLKPVTYTWKQDGSNGQGFIAHELQEVVPDCVVGDKDAVNDEGNPVYQGVDTSFLVATLTAAIQEQQTIINDLTARITALEGASL
jgi:hypothetical protein